MGQHIWNHNAILLTILQLQIIVSYERFKLSYPDTCNLSTENQLKIAYCGRYQDFKAAETEPFCYHVPHDLLPLDVEVFDSNPSEGVLWTAHCLTRSDFIRYKKLSRIIIYRNWIVHRNKLNRYTPYNDSLYADVFSDLDSLNYLEFVDSKLDDRCVITLPKNLKTLIVDDNLYTTLDVHWCSELEELSANNNSLINIPKFHNPLPPLKVLRLKGNPLSKMTILDIATICTLTWLELQFPSSYSYSDPVGQYCKCKMLKSWAKLADVSGLENLTCSNSQISAAQHDCSNINDTIEQAKTVREECLKQLKNGTIPSEISNRVRFNSTVSSSSSSNPAMKYFYVALISLLIILVAGIVIVGISRLTDSYNKSEQSSNNEENDDEYEEPLDVSKSSVEPYVSEYAVG